MNNAIRRLRRFVGLLGPVIALAAWSGTGHANAPPNRYTVTNGGTATGTVYDTFTGLTWQQAVPTSTYTWSAAITYCSSNTAGLPGTGWRLPKLKELQTIVDYTIAAPGPTIDPVAFPSTPVKLFWTSSPLAGGSSDAWAVYFGLASTVGSDVSNTYQVRCVR